MRPPISGTCVWGEKFFRAFAEWHLPSVYMADIRAFGAKPDYIVYSDAKTLPLFEELLSNRFFDDINLILFQIPPHAMEALKEGKISSGTLKQMCQRELIGRAWNEDRPFVWLYPDLVYGPGAFRAMANFMAQGYRAATSAGFCVRQTALEQEGMRERILGFDGTPMEWGALFLDHLHAFLKWRVWDSPSGNVAQTRWPCYLYTESAAGLFVNALQTNPQIVHPRRLVTDPFRGMEDDFLELAGLDPAEVKVMDDGSYVAIEIAEDEKPLGLVGAREPDTGLGLPLLTDEVLIQWARRVTTPYYRQFFRFTAPLAVRPGFTLDDCRETMERVSERARRILAQV